MGVEFERNTPTNYNYQPKATGDSGITSLVIKMGLAKDEAGANKVMIGVIIVCVALTIYIGF